ncbi:MAG: hypothetical protein ACKOPT_16480 [Cyanobium sp.]
MDHPILAPRRHAEVIEEQQQQALAAAGVCGVDGGCERCRCWLRRCDPANINTTNGVRPCYLLPQHPSPSEPLEGIPAGVQEGSRPAPVIGDTRRQGMPRT